MGTDTQHPQQEGVRAQDVQVMWELKQVEGKMTGGMACEGDLQIHREEKTLQDF